MIEIDKEVVEICKEYFPNLANSYKSIGNFEEAESLYNKAINSKPDYFQAINNYANLKALVFDYVAAIEFYKKALKIRRMITNNLLKSFNFNEAQLITIVTEDVIRNIVLSVASGTFNISAPTGQESTPVLRKT